MKTKSYRRRLIRRWSVLLLLLPLLSACSQGAPTNHEVNAAIDPPPSAIEQAMIQATSEATLSEAGEVVTVYLLDRNGYLAPMSLRVDDQTSSMLTSAKKAIAWMTVNGQMQDQLPQGFTAVLPEGTKVNYVSENQAAHTLTVDFAAPLPSIAAARERKVIEALVWTLTELPGINKVKLSVDGKPIRSLPSSGLPVDTVLTRGLGINLQTSKDVQPTHAMGVTLYFSSQTADGEGYFVPVTRLIERQPDAAKAALEQLILGPQNSKSLHAVMTSDMTIEKLTALADTVNVSLKHSDWEPESLVPSEMMEALVLTLTEATGLPQVRVVMNGDDSFLDSDQRSYDQPVMRPAYVNTLNRY